jgi:hypothetical protein
MLGCTGAPFPLPERTRRAGRVRAGGNDDKAHTEATNGALSEMSPEIRIVR